MMKVFPVTSGDSLEPRIGDSFSHSFFTAIMVTINGPALVCKIQSPLHAVQHLRAGDAKSISYTLLPLFFAKS